MRRGRMGPASRPKGKAPRRSGPLHPAAALLHDATRSDGDVGLSAMFFRIRTYPTSRSKLRRRFRGSASVSCALGRPKGHLSGPLAYEEAREARRRPPETGPAGS